MVKGKWYKAIICNEIWYIKFKELDNNVVVCSKYIYGNSLRNKEGNFGKLGNYDFKLLENLFEIQEFLPTDDLEKIKTYELW